MLRFVLLITLFLPFVSLAQNEQFKVKVHCFDLLSNKQLEGCSMTLQGKRPSARNTWFLSKFPVDDTLFLQHEHFTFQSLPISQYDYHLENNRIEILAYGIRKPQQVVSIDVPIARKIETKNTNASIRVYSDEGNPKFKLFCQNQSKTFLPVEGIDHLYEANLPYDQLSTGASSLHNHSTGAHYPLNSTNWMQITPLKAIDNYQWTEREKQTIHVYFSTLHSLRWRHKSKVRELQNEIESLKTEIEILNDSLRVIHGLPKEKPEVYAVDPGETPVRSVIDFPSVWATPKEGMTAFKELIRSELLKHTTKYGGNITIRVDISKDQKASYSVLHLADLDFDVIAVLDPIFKQAWDGAESEGRRIPSYVIFSIDIVQSSH